MNNDECKPKPINEDRTVKVVAKLPVDINYPYKNKRGIVLDSRGNLEHLLMLHNITVRFNAMKRFRDIGIPNKTFFKEEAENAALFYIRELAVLNQMPYSTLENHLLMMSWENIYHPIVDCMKDNPWDGVPRLEDFCSTLKTYSDQKFYNTLTRCWMISAMAAAFTKVGFGAQGMLVLQGPQNIGKTTWVKSLDPINCGAIREGALLQLSNKDCIIGLSKYWIVELGELDGSIRPRELAALKSHITSASEFVRAPFLPRGTELIRKTVYVGTVNTSRFLIDDTGNRRFWTIPLVSIDLNHGLDMIQVWAEVYHLFKLGESPYLSTNLNANLNEANKEHEQIDPFEEKLYEYFDLREDWQSLKTEKFTATKVLEIIGYSNPTQSDATRMGALLTKITKNKPERRMHVLPSPTLFGTPRTP